MLSQVGSITTTGPQQFGVTAQLLRLYLFGASTQPPTWPNIVPVPQAAEFLLRQRARVQ